MCENVKLVHKTHPKAVLKERTFKIKRNYPFCLKEKVNIPCRTLTKNNGWVISILIQL